MSLKFELPSFH